MKELFFKVTIANKIELPLSTEEMRQNPTFEMYMAEYEEKLISVFYKPADNFDIDSFVDLIKRKLKKEYKTAIIEQLEKGNKQLSYL